MMQVILVYILFFAAIVFLGSRFFGGKKAKKACGNDSCGCA